MSLLYGCGMGAVWPVVPLTCSGLSWAWGLSTCGAGEQYAGRTKWEWCAEERQNQARTRNETEPLFAFLYYLPVIVQ